MPVEALLLRPNVDDDKSLLFVEVVNRELVEEDKEDNGPELGGKTFGLTGYLCISVTCRKLNRIAEGQRTI